jgi:hypothetical protein
MLDQTMRERFAFACNFAWPRETLTLDSDFLLPRRMEVLQEKYLHVETVLETGLSFLVGVVVCLFSPPRLSADCFLKTEYSREHPQCSTPPWRMISLASQVDSVRVGVSTVLHVVLQISIHKGSTQI